MKLGSDDEHAESAKPKGSVSAPRRVHSAVSMPLVVLREVRFRTLYSPLRPPSDLLWGAVMPLSKTAFALKTLRFSPLLRGPSRILREAA
jgi:hypothetical protein